MIYYHKKNKKGFIILFAVTISSILLAIGLGVANIMLKEFNFSTTAKKTNEAFFAADTGVECALANDQFGDRYFVQNPSPPANNILPCLNTNLTLTPPAGGWLPNSQASWTFVVPSTVLSASQSCAKVTVTKDDTITPPFVTTTIRSQGYSVADLSCNPTSGSIERELLTDYDTAGENIAQGRIVTQLVPGDPVFDIPAAGCNTTPGTCNITDGDYTTQGYPAGFTADYEVDLAGSRTLSQINVVLCKPSQNPGDGDCFGYPHATAGNYITDWWLYGWNGSSWQNLATGDVPFTKTISAIFPGGSSMSKLRFQACSYSGANCTGGGVNWVGIYEILAY